MKVEARAFCDLLGRRRKVYRQVGDDEMRRVAATVMHGGIVALARPRPIREFDIAMAEGWAQRREPLLILDGIGNPQNIGAIARTAAFFGIRQLILSDHPGQAGLSDAAYRIAKGGLERIDVYRAARLGEKLRALGRIYEVVGTAIENAKPLGEMIAERGAAGAKPLALVMGNEEDGLPVATLSACSTIVALEGAGHVQSLNVGAAAAVLIHALLARPVRGTSKMRG